MQTDLPIGADTMSSELEFASNYHRWTNDWIRPWISGRVLDIGGGTGNHIALVEGCELVSIDVSTACIDRLRTKYSGRPEWRFEVADITDRACVDRLGRAAFDTVLSCNVFEHIDDDTAAFANARDLLRPGGRLVLVLPAHRLLLGSMDRLAGHFRRYDQRLARTRIAAAGLVLESLRYVNVLGAVGWFVNNRVVSHTNLSSKPINNQIRLFDRWLVPVMRRLEGNRPMPFGQSLVCVASRPGRENRRDPTEQQP